MTAACVFASAYLLFPLNGIQVKGAVMFQRSELSDFDSRGSSLLTLNSSALEKTVLEDPWVSDVSVEKNWSDNVAVVKVEERKPILMAKIDGEEVVFAPDGEELPGEGTVDLDPVEVEWYEVDGILRAVRTMRESGARVGSVEGYGVEGIEATVEGYKVIFSEDVGPEQARALRGVIAANPQASGFDLRSPGRVVVSGDPGDSAATSGGDPDAELEG